MFGKGLAKASAPGAAIIQFFGGIHEVYFPYVLMKPKLILAMIAGGFTQILINVIFASGLRVTRGARLGLRGLPGGADRPEATSPASPCRSSAAPRRRSLVAAFLLKIDKAEEAEDQLVGATHQMEALKGKSSSVASALTGGAVTAVAAGRISSIVFACDAGMGSSAMGASVLRKKIQDAGHPEVTVVNKAIANLERRLRHRGHPPGPHRSGQGADPVGGPRLGRQLHGQPAVRRDRGADRPVERRG